MSLLVADGAAVVVGADVVAAPPVAGVAAFFVLRGYVEASLSVSEAHESPGTLSSGFQHQNVLVDATKAGFSRGLFPCSRHSRSCPEQQASPTAGSAAIRAE